MVATVLLSALWLWTRLTGLSRSLWWDEVFTAHRYLGVSPGIIFESDSYSANNHVLYTLLTNLTTSALGDNEAVLRLWVVLPALVGLGVLVWFLWTHLGPPVAVVALALATASPAAARLETEARGYGIVLLAATVMLVVTARSAREPTWGADLAVAAAGLAAMVTFSPTVTLYLVHTGVWLLRRRTARVRLVVLTAAAGLGAALVLLPLIPKMLAWSGGVGSRYGEQVSVTSPFVAPLRILGGGILEGALPGPPGLAALVAVVLSVAGLVWLWPRAQELALQLVAALTGSVVLLGFAGYHLVVRYISFLLPHVLVVLAAGLVGVVAWAARERRVLGDAITLVAAASVAVLGYAAVQYETNVPRQDFKGVAAGVIAEDAEVIVSRGLHVGYQYYLGRDRVTMLRDLDRAEEEFCEGPRPAVYLRHPVREQEEPSCVDEAVERSVTQRDYGGSMGWYVLE